MKTRFTMTCLTLLGLGLASASYSEISRCHARQEPAPSADDPKGVEVLARGPVHEAFAEPAVRSPKPSPFVKKKPPEPIEELAPDQKPEGENVQFVPGYWAWDDEREDYIYVSGIWRAFPPGFEWIPGYWNDSGDGYQWVSGYWKPIAQESQQFLPQPPEPIVEAPPPAPTVEHVYVPGSWVYYDTRYMWQPGYWLLPRPGWVWIPPYYVWTPCGFIWVPGRWDFTFATRGLLFAPIYVQQPWGLGPSWVYRPRFVVQANFLNGSLFVRTGGWNRYYFGDYFDARYDRLGYTSWVSFGIGKNHYDPFFAQARWEHRHNPRWERDLRDLYDGRRAGKIPRPPQTLVQQNTVVQNIKNETNVTNVNVQNVTVLTALKQVPQTNPNIKLQQVTEAKQAEQKKNVQQFRELTKERDKISQQVIAKGSPLATKDKAASAPVKVDLPKARPVVPQVATVKAPDLPPAAKLPPIPAPTPGKPANAKPAIGKPGDVAPSGNKPADPKLPIKPGEAKPSAGKPVDTVPGNKPADPKLPPKPGEKPKEPVPSKQDKPPVKSDQSVPPPPKPGEKPKDPMPPKQDKPPVKSDQVVPPMKPVEKPKDPMAPKQDKPPVKPADDKPPAKSDKTVPAPKADKPPTPAPAKLDKERDRPMPPTKIEKPSTPPAPPVKSDKLPPPPATRDKPPPPPPSKEKAPPPSKEKEKDKDKPGKG